MNWRPGTNPKSTTTSHHRKYLSPSRQSFSLSPLSPHKHSSLSVTPLILDVSRCEPGAHIVAAAAVAQYFRGRGAADSSATLVHRVKADSNTTITAARLSPTVPGQFALGLSDGTVLVFANGTKRVLKHRPEGPASPLIAISFDPLSSFYLIAARRSGAASLYSLDAKPPAEVHAFERANGGITSVAFAGGCPGGFVTGDERTGLVRGVGVFFFFFFSFFQISN
jgi:hypothetical protein